MAYLPSEPVDTNDVIRREYAKNTPVKEIAALLDMKVGAVKMRAVRMGVADPARQAVAVAVVKANKLRATGGLKYEKLYEGMPKQCPE